MPQILLKDSIDPWKYVILLSKFMLLFVDGGITKSFGVLIPDMVARYESDYKTVAFVCGLPTTLMFFSGENWDILSQFTRLLFVSVVPIANLLMKVLNPRAMAMIGGFLSAVSVICAPLAGSIYILGMMLALTGFGMALTYFPITVSINNYFPKSFIFANTVTLFGTTCGAFLVPVIIERSLEAYGYTGGFLILGGISLHAVVCGAVVRPPKDIKRNNANTSTPSEQDSLMIQTADSILQETASKDETSKHMPEINDDTLRKMNRDSRCSSYRMADCSDCISSRYQLISKIKSFILLKELLYTLIIPAILSQCYVIASWMLFLVPHAEDKGVELSKAVFLSSIAGISGIFGRIFYLVLLHFKFDNVLIFCVTSLVCATSFFMDSLSSTYTFLAIMASIQGFTIFIFDSLPHAMMKLSVRNEENIQEAIALNPFLYGIGVIIGDVISGYIYDVTSSVSMVFMTNGVLLVIMAVNLVIYRMIDRHCPRDR